MLPLDRFDFILRARLRRAPAIVGLSFLGVLVLSVSLFLLLGNGKVTRVLFFPALIGRRTVAEERSLPRHRRLEENASELAEAVLLGPMRNDATRMFPRGCTVISSLMHGRTLYLDLSPEILLEDPDVPLAAQDALALLARSLRFNFPRIREVVFYIDGQVPRFSEKKNNLTKNPPLL
jgi:hypothetical protein